jgi:hypothetical protein
MEFAFYVNDVDGDSGVTIRRPGSGTIVYDFFIWPGLCLCMLTAVLFMYLGNSNLCSSVG